MSSYTKVFAHILDSTVWDHADHVRLAWITLLVKKDQYGVVRCSPGGLARAARIPLEKAEDAIRVLSSPDAKSGNREHDGRRIIPHDDGGWLVVSHEKYRKLLSAAERREARAAYMRDYRNRSRNQALPSVTKVTTSDQIQIKSEQMQREDPELARPPALDEDSETVVPLNLVARAGEKGVFSDMLAHMPGVTREQLEDKAREFVAYWTIGAGAGKRRRHWMAKLREDLRRAFLENRLNAPGLIEHAARTGRAAREAEMSQPKKPDPWAWQWEPGGPLYGQPRPTSGPEADPNRSTNGKRQ